MRMPGKWSKKRRNALFINCIRGKAVQENLGMKSDATVGALYDTYKTPHGMKCPKRSLG